MKSLVIAEKALCGQRYCPRAGVQSKGGINATRALTCKYNAQLSCGRVQTPTLAMIAKREEKIRSFIPESYYGMTAKGQNIMLTWQDQKSKSYRSFDKEKMTGLMKSWMNRKR